MGKEKSSSSKDDEDDKKFHSEASEGLSHAEFDRKVQSWTMKNYGVKYGKMLWEDTLVDLNKLDLLEELDNFTFEGHVTMVYDCVSDINDRHATSLFESARFWTKKFQLEWL